MAEDQTQRLSRELLELLQELRVMLPGVQVLFAAMATALLIAPSTYHRIQFRESDKERLLSHARWLSLAGTVFLALSVCSGNRRRWARQVSNLRPRDYESPALTD